jgi:CBS domain-containing protein
MKTKDLMVPLQDYLSPGNDLREAVNRLRTAFRSEDRVGVKGLPVLSSDGKLVGILSMRDILKAVYPTYMSMMDLGQFTWDGMLETLARQAGSKKVEEFMTREVITISEEDPLMECVDLMFKHDVRRLPVLDRSGKVAGMIYERDVFFAITKSMLEENNGGEK